MLLTDLQKTILTNYGFNLNEIEKVKKYLNPNWKEDLFDIQKIKDIEKSVLRLKTAIDNNEKIIIYADYDCDGIPGAVIMHDFLETINYKNYEIYIPNRHNEGYGLNLEAVQKFIKDKVKLIITIDLGITNFEEVKIAEENKIDVIITDHHLPLTNDGGSQILPGAYSIINTKQTDCEYEEKFLCGASTIWKFIYAFLEKYRAEYNIPIGFEKWLLDMVGIATIADMVPLRNENRLLAKFGLIVLRKTKRPGLRRIFENSKINIQKLSEDGIAFQIAPRINSASRLSDPMEAFKALLQNEESVIYADKLEKYNSLRKIETKKAIDSLDFEKIKKEKIILLGDKSWTPGILGLIASKVSEKTGKTTLVWGLGEDKNILKGSARAGEGEINVVEILSKVEKYLKGYGGHKEAGGFSLEKNNLKNLEKSLKEVSEKYFSFKEEDLIQTKDTTQNILNEKIINLKIENLNKSLYEELQIFAPFGIENEKIIFRIILDKAEMVEFKKFGKNREHLEMIINHKVRAIEFFIDKDREEELKNQKEFLFHLEWDNFRNDIVLKFLK